MRAELCIFSKHYLNNTVQYLLHFNRWKHFRKLVTPPPGGQHVGPAHIEAPSQSRAVSQPERLLLAGWLYSGGSSLLQRSDTPRCHWLSSLFPSSLPSPLLPLSTHITGVWCEGRLQLGSAQFRGGGFTEPPVGAQTNTVDTKLWCGPMLRPAPQVRICGITVISDENYMFVQSHPFFGPTPITFLHHIVSIEIPRSMQCWEVSSWEANGNFISLAGIWS